MTAPATMHVHLRLPTRLLFAGEARHVFAVAENGALGILPAHTDYVASLVPSVLVVTDTAGREQYFGIDHGLLVKHGTWLDVIVRRGIHGPNLDELARTIEASFQQEDEQERVARTALSRLELGIIRQLGQLDRPAP